MSKEIIFFNRAYNDMDFQAPLMAEFAKDPEYRVRIIGYPCDGFVGAPEEHESARWLQTFQNLCIETVFDFPQTPLFLRAIHKFERLLKKARGSIIGKYPVFSNLVKYAHVFFLQGLAYFIKKPQPWLLEMTANLSPDIIIVDEILAQPNRSQIIDDVIPELHKKGSNIYVIQTGQHVYLDPFLTLGKMPVYKPTSAINTFLASDLDQKIYTKQFPNEPTQAMGNLRMDKNWINTLCTNIIAPPFYDRRKIMDKLPKGKVHIVFMLSKLNYGVDANYLSETIRTLGVMQDVAIAIKPHTRGMKFNFMDKTTIGNSIDAFDIPSAVLIDWADIVLFTGSGIAFHSMIANKHTGLLKYCQKMETIFDDGACCHVFNSKEEIAALASALIDGNGDMTEIRKKEISSWLVHNVYGGNQNGNTPAFYKSMIERDMASQDNSNMQNARAGSLK